MNTKSITLIAVIAAILLGTACTAQTPAARTVTSTAATTVLKTTTATATTTQMTTDTSTEFVTSTVTATPGVSDGNACTGVAAELGSLGILETLQQWSGGGGLTVGDLAPGIAGYSDIKEQGQLMHEHVAALNLAGRTFRDSTSTDQKDVADQFATAWSEVTEACNENGTPIPPVKVVTSTVIKTTTVPVGADGAPVSAIANGEYLVPGQIKPGVYQCSNGDSPYWESTTRSGDIIDNGLSTIARVPSDAYSMTLKRCLTDWKNVS